ncbi:MAG: glycosyltransferase [Deltaproteobacteria bacterium]|nr:glycosyltransferase [Deltaproteobacteria bacterium]
MSQFLATIPVALCSAWTILGSAALARLAATRAPNVAPVLLPAVTVLKPLCGADPSLEDCLESFFTQTHPRYELVFGVTDPEDPALAVVERLRARHPEVTARVVVHAPPPGQNPKIANLRGMVPYASHDLVLVSDSNVRAPAHYVAAMCAVAASDPEVGLVSTLFVGSGGTGLGSALESVQLAGFCAAGVALPTAFGDAAVIGKSMLFSLAACERLGGLERLADVLAEDYVLGKMFQHSGRRVVLAPVIIENVLGRMTLKAFADRHLRWSMMRFRLRPFAFLLEPLTCPLAVLPFAWALWGPWALAWAVSTLFLRDVVASVSLRGARELHRPMVYGWLRDAVVLVVWALAFFRKHISWRGHRVRMGAGTLLFAER